MKNILRLVICIFLNILAFYAISRALEVGGWLYWLEAIACAIMAMDINIRTVVKIYRFFFDTPVDEFNRIMKR